MTTSTSAAAAPSCRSTTLGSPRSETTSSAPSVAASARPVLVATGADDLGRAKVFGDLHGHQAGAPGGAEDEHALTGAKIEAFPQGDPGGHAGVHTGGDQQRVGGVRQGQAAPGVDDGVLGHRPHRRVGEQKVDQCAVEASDPIDARNQGKLLGAGVVRARGLGAHSRVQPGGDHVESAPRARPRRWGWGNSW